MLVSENLIHLTGKNIFPLFPSFFYSPSLKSIDKHRECLKARGGGFGLAIIQSCEGTPWSGRVVFMPVW